MDNELEAIKAIDFNWVRPSRSIWSSRAWDVQTLNASVLNALSGEVFDGDGGSESDSQVGQVVIGPAGIGKTHLLGNLRDSVWNRDGWFILLDIIGIKEFWATAALSYLQSLQQPYKNGLSQGDAILCKLCVLEDVGRELKRKHSLLRTADGTEIFHLMDSVLRGLEKKHHTQTVKYGEVIGAFVLLQCNDRNVSSQAYSWLQGIGVDELPLKNPVPPSKVVEAISWLISLTGPTLLAVDQLDPIVSYHNLIASGSDDLAEDEERQAKAIIEGLCRGLSEIFDVTFRTTTVLSCLEATWQILQDRAVASFQGRFNEPILLAPITDPQAAEELITARTMEAFQAIGFNPKYVSWPVAKEAFTTAIGLLPREILRKCDAHRRKCIRNGMVLDLTSFASSAPLPPAKPITDSTLNDRFAALRAAADVAGLCCEEREDELPELLLKALECYCLQTELPDNVDIAVEGDPNKRKPSLHARLTHVHRSEGDREEHHCFRAISHANAIAFQSRLKAAMTAAGIDMALPFRHLLIIRSEAPPSGTRTQQLCQEFSKAGGKFGPLSDNDLRIMVALKTMLKERPEGFELWLKQRKPLCAIAMFREAGLCGAGEVPPSAKPQSLPKQNAEAEQLAIAGKPQRAECEFKTRVSVINFSGLPADEAKQSFVNQLEMALFSWIKKNPTPSDRPLTGLLVMDEAQNFAPAQKSTPCKESTIALVAQARKYGLGMIFATQVPKNIDSKIISNCTTHFYGKMNAPATIEAVRELMAAKGGGGGDIANLKAGEFYFTTEGMPRAEKIKTPLCLSYHPQNPLPQEEVVKRAKASV